MTTSELLSKARAGFGSVKIDKKFHESALNFLEQWLTNPQFKDYVPQIEHMIVSGHWDYLVDSFYKIIPFGTGGRRGEVGIGPNRINPWTIQSSAQGHAQYLKKIYGDQVKTRGIVLAYDIRQFTSNEYYNDSLPNPVKNLTSKDLAFAAAQTYVANNVRVYLFDDIRTTPELSFAIRYLKAVAGDMISASHNPPSHNGKKVYDEFGGQLIPPYDEKLVDEVTKEVKTIHTISLEELKKHALFSTINKDVDEAYVNVCTKLSLSSERDVKIAYTSLHGCGIWSLKPVMEKLGFHVQLDPETCNPSGKFEHITFNNPNPEVVQSFDVPLKFAEKIQADIILSSDPDADRLGVMVKDQGTWKFINGNDIGAILTKYVIDKRLPTLKGQGIIIKTDVTTNLISKICEKHGVKVIGDLLVGFKYIGNVMNDLEKDGTINNFLFGSEESHGYIAGNYVRDKDAVVAAIWLSELAASLKKEGKTLVDYLNDIYVTYGYFSSYQSEIRMLGAEGMGQIQSILTGLRNNTPTTFGKYVVDRVDDWMKRTPFVSETDKSSKNGIVFNFKPVSGTASLRVTVRPSGTEPKVKMYYELGSEPCKSLAKLDSVRTQILDLQTDLERSFMKTAYKLIGVDFPDRGFLLFSQLPLKDKLKYFEIEEKIVDLKKVKDKTKRVNQLNTLLSFLGADPIKKIDQAFKAKYKDSLSEYLDL